MAKRAKAAKLHKDYIEAKKEFCAIAGITYKKDKPPRKNGEDTPSSGSSYDII